MTLIDGKHIAAQCRAEMKDEICAMLAQGQRAPHLAIVIVGHNPASETYVNNKLKAAQEIGIQATKFAFEETITEAELLQEIDKLNADARIDGFIVQLPLPAHINESHITCAIDYRKDVDGLTPENIGRTMLGLPSIVSATPLGIRELLRRYQIETCGKRVVVIGRSNIVGKPIAMLLLQKEVITATTAEAHTIGTDATVTLCHSRTENLQNICLAADIIIVAAGQAGLLKGDMVREGATVIDVGINRLDDPTAPRGYRLVGDVAFDEVAPKCAYITPVPGGVGPMTIVSLLQNTLQARLQNMNN